MGGTGGRWGRDVVLRLAVGSRWTRSVEGRWAGVEKWERSGGSRMRRLGGGRGEVGVLTLVMLEIGVASSEGSAATLNLAGIGAFSGAEGSVAASQQESRRLTGYDGASRGTTSRQRPFGRVRRGAASPPCYGMSA